MLSGEFHKIDSRSGKVTVAMGWRMGWSNHGSRSQAEGLLLRPEAVTAANHLVMQSHAQLSEVAPQRHLHSQNLLL